MKLVKELKTYSHTIIIIDPNKIVLSEFKVGDLIKVCGYIIRVNCMMWFRNIGHIYLEFQTAGKMPAGEMERFYTLSGSADKFMEEAKHYEDV